MRYSLLLLLLILLSGTFLFSAFQSSEKPDSREILIQKEVRKKVNSFVARRKKRCRDKIMKQASELVDSILIVRARAMTIDTFQKPPIPPRPDRPDVPVLEDTMDISPLLPPRDLLDSLMLDTLIRQDTSSNNN